MVANEMVSGVSHPDRRHRYVSLEHVSGCQWAYDQVISNHVIGLYAAL